MRSPVMAMLGWVFLAWGGSGCSAPKATFLVDVKNNTPLPLSVGLVKSGGRIEEGFTSPEHIAINAPQYAERKWGVLVAAGQTVTLGPQTGSFETGTRASLRVYSGDVPVSALLAYGRSDPGRLDLPLWPGQSGYIIDLIDGRLHASPMDQGRIGAPAGGGGR